MSNSLEPENQLHSIVVKASDLKKEIDTFYLSVNDASSTYLDEIEECKKLAFQLKAKLKHLSKNFGETNA